ncbi:hypothetical protein Xoosp13_374 [Xanthomonas phage Xoo-sp13]|nr:hypothetical protein Xoosp13_374 [Xanthomonas phage Xoo-sp13]
MSYKYKQNDIVDFNVTDSVKGIGIIVGICDVTQYDLSYMVRVVSVEEGCVKFPNAGYPYDTISCPEFSLSCRSCAEFSLSCRP